MLSRRAVLGVVPMSTVRGTLYLSLDVAGEALGKWANGNGSGHLEVFLQADEVVKECLDEIDRRVYIKTGKNRGEQL